jgi:hypothetical protein
MIIAINQEVINKGSDFKALTHCYKNESLTTEQLAEQISKGYAQSFCKMKQCACSECDSWKEKGFVLHRKNESFDSSELFALDIDNSEPKIGDDGKRVKGEKQKTTGEKYFSLEAALSNPFIQENALLIYPSCSHTEDWHKYRLVFRLSSIVTDSEEYREIISAFMKKFGGDEACKDACRAYYGNKGCTPNLLGKTLTVDALNTVLKPYRKKKEIAIASAQEKIAKKKISEFKGGEQKKRIEGVLTPFDDYDQRGNPIELLCSHGWKVDYEKGGVTFLTRPGKDKGVSATFNFQEGGYPPNRFYCFTSSTEFNANKCYKPYAVYALLECNGDFKEATKNLAKEGYGDPLPPLPPEKLTFESVQASFWYAVRGKFNEDTGKYPYFLKIDTYKLRCFIENNGFAPMFLEGTNGESIFVRLQDNIVEEVTPHTIKDFVFDWVSKLDSILPLDTPLPEVQFYRSDLIKALQDAENVYFSKTKLECIVSVKPKFHKDSRKEAYFYFKNGFVTVSKDSITLKHYSELKGAIWKKQKIQRNFTSEDSSGEYANFLFNVCNKERVRFTALSSAIGYLLHRFKDSANAKAVILVDEKISDSPEGGTGKSLIATALGKLRNVIKIDGKDFDFDNRFAFQDVGLDTDTVVFDDIGAKFPFERLFHKITDGMETERKGQNRVKRPFEDSPKFFLTTNYTVQGEGGSAERRKVEYELYGHYSKTFTPRDEVGHNFFDEWDEKEWAKFDNFMLERVKLFLSLGLTTYKHKNLDQRKIVQETSQEFFEFMDDFFYKIEGVEKRDSNKGLLGEEISIPELIESFCFWSPDYKKRLDKGIFTQVKFTKWLKKYAEFSNFKIETWQKQLNRENRYQCIRFFK